MHGVIAGIGIGVTDETGYIDVIAGVRKEIPFCDTVSPHLLVSHCHENRHDS
jgi:hypothetical protein